MIKKERHKNIQSAFIPMSKREMEQRGWHELDFLMIVGDAYVDHPSFGIAVISRLLESLGYKVGIVAQPDWRNIEDFAVMGKPRFGVFVSAGNLDSMLSNYSSPGKRRARDDYSPSGAPKKRPDRATIVYCNIIRQIWGDIPLMIGGIEASLRRIAHYDYWTDEVRRSILTDSRADILIYGMAEQAVKTISRRLASSESVRNIRDVAGTCWKTHNSSDIQAKNGFVGIASYEEVSRDKRKFSEAFKVFYDEQNFASGRAIVQDQGAWIVVQNPPSPPLSTESLDRIYSLPYARAPHPSYGEEKIPAFDEVRFSITSHRGCFGECSFCAITLHQGRIIQARSFGNILSEAKILSGDAEFKGYIHDVGGPTANFRIPSCEKSVTRGACKGKSCVFPKYCPKLRVNHREYLELLKRVSKISGVKKVFVRSGIRMDYILADPDGQFFLEELCRYHVSGQLKIAPEHASPEVLRLMRKSDSGVTERFIKIFREINERIGKKQFVVPYFMSSHPGCGIKEALELVNFMRKQKVRPEQTQEFTPTPGTVSACMYYSGVDPFTGKDVHVPKDNAEKVLQRALLQYWMPQNKWALEVSPSRAKKNRRP